MNVSAFDQHIRREELRRWYAGDRTVTPPGTAIPRTTIDGKFGYSLMPHEQRTLAEVDAAEPWRRR